MEKIWIRTTEPLPFGLCPICRTYFRDRHGYRRRDVTCLVRPVIMTWAEAQALRSCGFRGVAEVECHRVADGRSA
jgi:hypothetical protein